MIRQMQSNEGITLLDKEDEFQAFNWNFAGVYDALQAFAEQIAGATGIPLIRLLGQSPKGFSSGDSDMRAYYDTIATQLDDDKRPADNMLFGILSRHLWGKPLPDDFAFDYQSLFVPTEAEKSQIATADAQAAAGLVGADIISKALALSELKNAGRLTGRYTSITEEDIEAARQEAAAPPALEGMEELSALKGESGSQGF
jgi:phage-related protein (TIGR01555 family)